MKSQFLLLIFAVIISSCGIDSGDPSSMTNNPASGIDLQTGAQPIRVKPASFGLYDSVINAHPETRRASLYRLYKKEGRNYILQKGYADEIKLQFENEESQVQLILYKERLSSSKVGDFDYFEMVDGNYKLVASSKAEFRAVQMGEDEANAFLVFKLYIDNQLTKEFKLSFDLNNSLQYSEDENLEVIYSPISTTVTQVQEVVGYGNYIEENMMPNRSCIGLTAGKVVKITSYTTNAAKSVEYRNCYWNLYDKIIKKFVKAHKDATTAGDEKGIKCRSSIYKKIKKDLTTGKSDCVAQFGE